MVLNFDFDIHALFDLWASVPLHWIFWSFISWSCRKILHSSLVTVFPKDKGLPTVLPKGSFFYHWDFSTILAQIVLKSLVKIKLIDFALMFSSLVTNVQSFFTILVTFSMHESVFEVVRWLHLSLSVMSALSSGHHLFHTKTSILQIFPSP